MSFSRSVQSRRYCILTTNHRRIPFYKASEATAAIRPLLGDLYHREERSFLGQLWSSFTQCKYVEADPAVPGALRWAGQQK